MACVLTVSENLLHDTGGGGGSQYKGGRGARGKFS